MQKKLMVLGILFLPLFLNAKSNTETLGDILSAIIPIGGYGTALYLDDKEGQTEFYKSYGTTLATTYALKYSVREKRPDSDAQDSFPSGHTSSAFSGASFIHKRYGFKYAVVPYLGAIYTAYSRVHSNRHYRRDVVAGAILGTASSWYFTTSYNKVEITPSIESKYQGVKVSYKW